VIDMDSYETMIIKQYKQLNTKRLKSMLKTNRMQVRLIEKVLEDRGDDIE